MPRVLPLVLAACVFQAVPAVSAELVTRGGELICFKRDALGTFAKLIRDQGSAAVESVPGCIAARPGLVLTSRGAPEPIQGVGPVTRIRAVSYSTREFFEGFTTARF
jgi:hypothetical protein